MAVELAASRILAPYFGSSILIWGNVIGVVMVALAVGYYVGGKMADKTPNIKVLMYNILFAGVIISFVPWLVKPISINILPAGSMDYQLFLIFGSFLVMLLLFALPLFILGMVSPFVIRLLIVDVKQSGQVAGSVYAFSTLGSILGTFSSAFLIIPWLGSRETLLICSFLLILISSIGLVKKPWFFFFLLLPILIYFGWSDQTLSSEASLIYEKESLYHLVQIVQSGEKFHLKFNEGSGVQSTYIPGQPLVGAYYDYYSFLPYFFYEDDLDILLIGAGGGTIPNIFVKLLADEFDLTIDSVEIDQEVIKAAELYLDYPSDQINTIISDGRTYLRSNDKKYDIIIVDAYAQQYYIPWHLTTKEFFTEIKSHLSVRGILAINENSKYEDSILMKSISQTMRSVFSNLYVVPAKYAYNYMVMASNRTLNFSNWSAISNPDIQVLMRESEKNYWQVDQIEEKYILTDNKAPIEFYTESSLN